MELFDVTLTTAAEPKGTLAPRSAELLMRVEELLISKEGCGPTNNEFCTVTLPEKGSLGYALAFSEIKYSEALQS